MVEKKILIKIMGLACVFFLFNVFHSKSQTTENIDTILSRYKIDLIRYDTYSASVDHFINIIEDVGNAGYGAWKVWPDIDYKNHQSAKWDVLKHLDRVKDMVLAWSTPNSKWYHNDLLWSDIKQALDYWLFHRFYNPNWYHNEISVPQRMQDILILIGSRLSEYEYVCCLEEMNQFRFNGTGSNLILSSKLGFYYGALTRDSVLMKS